MICAKETDSFYKEARSFDTAISASKEYPCTNILDRIYLILVKMDMGVDYLYALHYLPSN